jgi:hypothetical protein
MSPAPAASTPFIRRRRILVGLRLGALAGDWIFGA